MKGQYFSFDAIVATIIFVLAFTSLITYWYSMKSSLESLDEDAMMEAARISDYILRPGFLTISKEDLRLNYTKLQNLPDDSKELKKALNIPYGVRIELRDFTGNELISKGVIPQKTKRVAKIQRNIVVYDDLSNKEYLASMYIFLFQ